MARQRWDAILGLGIGGRLCGSGEKQEAAVLPMLHDGVLGLELGMDWHAGTHGVAVRPVFSRRIDRPCSGGLGGQTDSTRFLRS